MIFTNFLRKIYECKTIYIKKTDLLKFEINISYLNVFRIINIRIKIVLIFCKPILNK